MWFIDMLNVHQDYDKLLPIFGSQMVIRVDLQTGEQLTESPKSSSLEGSYSSKLYIRCNGTRVSVQGNPSRWHRLDNLFGFQSISDCIAVYNQILLGVGLPPFTPCVNYWYRQSDDGTVAKLVADGAMIDRIDFTRNLSVTSGRELDVLRSLSTFSISKSNRPFLYSNGCTVDWNQGSTYQYRKIYQKSVDLVKHRSKRLINSTMEEQAYYQKLIDWCDSTGLLREEHSFKQKFLVRHKLHFFRKKLENEFTKYLNDIYEAMKRLKTMKEDIKTVAKRLIEQNIVTSKRSAKATQNYALNWLCNLPIEKNSQYYVHKKRLLQLGIDISVPCKDPVNVPDGGYPFADLNISILEPPDWYRMPKVSNLKLVS